jgi:glycosyltransferase involved in cell wall biosynthesis
VGGIPEIMTAPEAGVLLKERTAAGIAAAVRQLFDHYPSREATRRFAETLSWEETTRGQLALFERVLQRTDSGRDRERLVAAAAARHG